MSFCASCAGIFECTTKQGRERTATASTRRTAADLVVTGREDELLAAEPGAHDATVADGWLRKGHVLLGGGGGRGGGRGVSYCALLR